MISPICSLGFGESMTEKKQKEMDIWGIIKDMQKITTDHMKLMLDQYKEIRGIYGKPNKNLMDTVTEQVPESSQKFYELFNMWLEDQLSFFEKNIDEMLREYADSISTFEYFAPSTYKYRMLVDEHTKLWIENYQKLKERRNWVNKESLASLKKMLPETVHPILDYASKWLEEQNERMDKEIIERVKKYSQNIDTDDK
jgi:hypothetical protein